MGLVFKSGLGHGTGYIAGDWDMGVVVKLMIGIRDWTRC